MTESGFRISIKTLPVVFAIVYWALNAAFLGPSLPEAAGMEGFLKNIAIAATAVAGISAACLSFAAVECKPYSFGENGMPGIDRRSILLPFALSLGVTVLGMAVSAAAVRHWLGSDGLRSFLARCAYILPVGACFALMGSFIGNLAGSGVLEAREYGRWTRVNIVLLVFATCFWGLLTWAVLVFLRRAAATPVP